MLSGGGVWSRGLLLRTIHRFVASEPIMTTDPRASPPGAPPDDYEWLRSVFIYGSARRSDVELADDELRAMGLRIDGGQVSLPHHVEVLTAGRVVEQMQLLPTPPSIRVEPVLASTSTTLIQRLQSGVDVEDVLVADYQYGGRGRRGRTWVSPIGYGVAMSVACRLNQPIASSASISLVAGVAVAEALEHLGAADHRLKWPNDVLRGSSKVCGILAEVASSDPACIVLGIGINVGGTSVTPSVDQQIADLSDLAVSRASVIAAVLERLMPAVEEYDRTGFAVFRDRWERRHGFQHKPVTIHIGEQRVDGIVRGVALDGRLEVATDSGLQRFSAGEVSMRPSGSPSGDAQSPATSGDVS